MRKGQILTKEMKTRLSQARFAGMARGTVPPPWNKGKPWSQEVKDKIGAANRGNFPSLEVKAKISAATSGSKNHNWMEDRKALARFKDGNEYRNSPAHREWSRQVKKRDKWVCRISDENCKGRMVSHHILSWKDHPELRYQINNGITLCHHHHPRKKEDEARLSPFFQVLVGEAN